MTDSKLCMQKSSNHGDSVPYVARFVFQAPSPPQQSAGIQIEIKVTMQKEVASFQWSPIPAVCHCFHGAFKKLPAQKQR